MTWEDELRKALGLTKPMDEVLESIKKRINSLERSKNQDDDKNKTIVEDLENALDEAENLMMTLTQIEKEYSEYYIGGGLRQNPAYAGKNMR